MPTDIQIVIKELRSTLEDKSKETHHLIPAQRARDELIALNEQASRLADDLAERDKAVGQAVGEYLRQIETTREAFSPGGWLADSVQTKLEDEIKAILPAEDASQISAVQARVETYDKKTHDALKAARDSLDTAEQDLAESQADFKRSASASDGTKTALSQHAALALRTISEARSTLSAIKQAIQDKRPYEAFVRWQDLSALRSNLTAKVSLTEPLKFAVEEIDPGKVKEPWTADRDQYAADLSDLIQKQQAVIEARQKLATVQAETQHRETDRLEQAARPSPKITTDTLPAGQVSHEYGPEDLAADQGGAPYSWTLGADTRLPPELELSAGGRISGTPTSADGSPFKFTVTVTDAYGLKGDKELEIAVNP